MSIRLIRFLLVVMSTLLLAPGCRNKDSLDNSRIAGTEGNSGPCDIRPVEAAAQAVLSQRYKTSTEGVEQTVSIDAPPLEGGSGADGGTGKASGNDTAASTGGETQFVNADSGVGQNSTDGQSDYGDYGDDDGSDDYSSSGDEGLSLTGDEYSSVSAYCASAGLTPDVAKVCSSFTSAHSNYLACTTGSYGSTGAVASPQARGFCSGFTYAKDLASCRACQQKGLTTDSEILKCMVGYPTTNSSSTIYDSKPGQKISAVPAGSSYGRPMTRSQCCFRQCARFCSIPDVAGGGLNGECQDCNNACLIDAGNGRGACR